MILSGRAYSAIIARSKLANYPTEARIGFNAAATPWAIRCIPASFGWTLSVTSKKSGSSIRRKAIEEVEIRI